MKNSKNEEELHDALETERLRLAACGVAALCNTDESMKLQLLKDNSPYYSASYRDVVRMAEREILLIKKCKKLKCLMLLTDPSVSNIIIGDTQHRQFIEFVKTFPDEGVVK